MSSTSPDPRLPELDLLRTFAILLMVIYHAGYDLSAFYDAPIDPLSGGWLLLQRVTANLFLLLVGVSGALSYGRMVARGTVYGAIRKRFFLRGSSILLAALLVTVATRWALGDTYVRFGVLHLIGVCVCMLPFFLPLREWNALLAIIIVGISSLLPATPVDTVLLLPIGMMPGSFASIDYFPVLPWAAPVLFGAALGHALYVRRLLTWHMPQTPVIMWLGAPGRHALTLYLVHQPVLLGTLWLLRTFGGA